MIDDVICRRLLAAARAVRVRSYAPYSRFSVGAAVLGTDGMVYTGCNVENASYGLTICAERNAMTHAVAAGCREFTAAAIVGNEEHYTPPCGACRQVLAEFNVPLVILGKNETAYTIVPLAELLPFGFNLL